MAKGYIRVPKKIRFWHKVVVTNDEDCWKWDGAKAGNGYGRLHTGDKHEYAHRISWEFANGPIPEGLDVLHRCDNPECTNPRHLFLGTHQDNMADRDNKGRGRGRNKD